MNLQIIMAYDYHQDMTLFRPWGLLSFLLAGFLLIAEGFSAQATVHTALKKNTGTELIEQFSPDLNIQARQQNRRLNGFYEHQSEGKRFDQIRERGELDYNEELLKWEEERAYQAKKYKSEKKVEASREDRRLKEQNLFEKEKKLLDDEQVRNRQKYILAREKIKEQSQRQFSEEQEIGVYVQRPRYEVRKRVLYGARPRSGSSGGKSAGGGSGGGSSGFEDSSPTSTMPPPSDSGNMDYFPPPPPPPPMDDYNMPPPPPPMDDFGGPPQPDFGMPPPPPPDFNPGGY